MKISYSWLRSYMDLELPANELGDVLTNIGLEVEGLEEFRTVKGGLEGVVCGEVLSCEKHPNADNLTLCKVDIGEGEPLPIVCGAPNVAAGQKVPVATVGCTLWPGDESLVIKKSKIRGEVSMGMICAEDELGLGSSHDGIMVLDPETKPGTPASEYFKIETDHIFEIGLTPNRVDAASHLGVARDLCAWSSQSEKIPVTLPPVDDFKVTNWDLPMEVEVLEEAGCKRYSGLTMTGLQVKESPDWLKNRLRSIGQTPINNVVDVTNFVLHECGQPLHAFDASQIRGNKVVVRTLPEGTPFVTLDGQERKLQENDLMICDQQDGMCIAGIFGGEKSGVTGHTTSIFLESACFDPVYVRKTAKHHGLNTDASFRFERGSDPNITVYALKRAALLIMELAGGQVSSNIWDYYPDPVEDFSVEVLFSNIDRLIGNPIPPATVRSIVEALEIKVEVQNETGMLLKIPPYRVDVQREADVIEEILRIYGFNRVEIGQSLSSTLSWSEKPDKEQAINRVSDMLSGNGFFEMKSNSLTRASYHDQDGEEDPEAVRIFNPLSQDLGHMRKSLLFGGLEAVAWNINRKNPNLRLYEFGACYFKDPGARGVKLEERFREELRMGIFLSGQSTPGNWVQKAREAGFPGIKRWVESCLHYLGIDPDALDQDTGSHPFFAEYLCYTTESQVLVEYGKMDRKLLKQFDIKQDVYAAEFRWDLLLKLLSGHRILFSPLAKYQPVKRDFSLLLDRRVDFRSLRDLAFATEKKLLRKVELFDVYEGDKIEKGKKSYALSFILLDENKTLNDKQIDRVMMNLARAFEKELKAQVRGLN